MGDLERDGQALSADPQYRTLLAVSEAIVSHRDLATLFHDLAGRLHLVVRFDYLACTLHDTTSNTMRANWRRRNCEVNSSGRHRMNAGSPKRVTVSAICVSARGARLALLARTGGAACRLCDPLRSAVTATWYGNLSPATGACASPHKTGRDTARGTAPR